MSSHNERYSVSVLRGTRPFGVIVVVSRISDGRLGDTAVRPGGSLCADFRRCVKRIVAVGDGGARGRLGSACEIRSDGGKCRGLYNDKRLAVRTTGAPRGFTFNYRRVSAVGIVGTRGRYCFLIIFRGYDLIFFVFIRQWKPSNEGFGSCREKRSKRSKTRVSLNICV